MNELGRRWEFDSPLKDSMPWKTTHSPLTSMSHFTYSRISVDRIQLCTGHDRCENRKCNRFEGKKDKKDNGGRWRPIRASWMKKKSKQWARLNYDAQRQVLPTCPVRLHACSQMDAEQEKSIDRYDARIELEEKRQNNRCGHSKSRQIYSRHLLQITDECQQTEEGRSAIVGSRESDLSIFVVWRLEINSLTVKRIKYFWLFCPTQLFTKTQWWSIRLIHRLQTLVEETNRDRVAAVKRKRIVF